MARKADTLTAGMYLIGCLYNFCDPHHSLRVKLWVGSHGYRWVPRTPAIAADLTDYIWSWAELFAFKAAAPCWQLPKERGRLSQATLRLIEQWCQ